MNTHITFSKIQLTEEQRRLLELLAVEGCTHDQLARKINVSRPTVERYLFRIRDMLGVNSLNQVIAIAVAKGWISAPKMGKRPE